VIKYLGSKRVLAPQITQIAVECGAQTAVDLFTGTTRVAQEFKRAGMYVTAADIASYSAVLSDCYIAADADEVDMARLGDALARLNALPGKRGYFTRTFCEEARFFQPKNGMRVDAIRDAIEADYASSPLYPILLTALLLAADRVDSTIGLQMAYLKQWAPRSHNDLRLETPGLIPGRGRTMRGDAADVVAALEPVDLMYLDPPYNQHRYFGNYHIWETLIRWDAPPSYGVARKRADVRDPATRSRFNSKREMPAALAELLRAAKARVLLVSYNDESWITAEEMTAMLRAAGREKVELLAFDHQRHVGARIGIFSPEGKKVGAVGRTRNVEYLFAAR
jgi:adenine-specific DNA-methyltransferase